ncbi:MAG: hypothetical protein BGP11_01805 [Rhodobacterales bacterium 65-51]|uniref:hypothetical protein n=1 Tax=uncultured Gemmobacter sp. TaxID=1095917 RepID=UPI000959A2E5|nr:hypothetical protein [uncultured Gemmobacter sp.]OJY32730.1 MAG: hypothetical protein BGP11_01805 [Rhodobacterales bacterium 65-51]
MMQVVSESSEADIKRHGAEVEIKMAWRRLTANVLRIAAGAGKPNLVLDQMADYAKATRDYEAATGSPFRAEDHLARYANADVALLEYRDWVDPSSMQTSDHYAERKIINGAMRVHAGYLLDQLTQVSTGESMMSEGVMEKHLGRK